MALQRVLLIGAGLRGILYSEHMLDFKDKYQIVAVAEPIKERREGIRDAFGIPDEMCFEDWKDVLKLPKFADLALVTTMDKDHVAPALKAMEKGYDILIEKPIATSEEECLALEEAAQKYGVKVIVCFVLRYARFYKAIKEFMLAGRLGDIINMVHIENVGNHHQAHSFVRGNWRNSKETTFMLLAKSSHDMDIMQWFIGKKCKKVQSFGSLSFFKKENKPEGSPERCIEGCPYGDACFYNSVKLYLEKKGPDWYRNAACRVANNPTDEQVERALWETDYGKCVFNCDNDVVDHQVVNLEYEGGVTASFTMSAFNKGGRTMHIMGTKGMVYGNSLDSYFTFYDFATEENVQIQFSDIVASDNLTDGHGGGDRMLVQEMYDYLNDTYEGYSITPFEESVDNHLTTFAAEYSRIHGGQTVDIEEFKKSLKDK